MPRVGIIGAGPAGLMAAEAAAEAGASVMVFEAQPTAGRKLLMAGKSGLNITHSEDLERFVARYGAARPRLQSALDAFDGPAVRDWCAGLGVETFVGSSGRVFPKAMKASPLLRAWLARLGSAGVTLRTRARWTGWADDQLVIETPDGQERHGFDAVVLAMGGASWPRLGSDGAWTAPLGEAGIGMAPFRPANCGFEVDWSPVFVERFAGAPVKAVVAESDAGSSAGEFVISRAGVEGSLVYTHSSALRDRLEADGSAVLHLDLVPGRTVERLTQDLARQKPGTSFANRLRKGAGLEGVKAGLVRELMPEAVALPPDRLAAALKHLPLPLLRTRPMAEAISVAGGVVFDALDPILMVHAKPGLFIAGEMLDWEAPTGGYLLTACLATGRLAGQGAAQYARKHARED